jgi:hypothetical protein
MMPVVGFFLFLFHAQREQGDNGEWLFLGSLPVKLPVLCRTADLC